MPHLRWNEGRSLQIEEKKGPDSKLQAQDFPGGTVVKTSPFSAEGACLVPDQGAKIPQASQPKNQNIKKKQYCNKFKKDFKNGPYQKIFKKNQSKQTKLQAQRLNIEKLQ